jgi:trimethylamine--corrinoid protein Co-methyltransferase
MRAQMRVLDDEARSATYEQALSILQRVGMRFSGARSIERLREAGARVDAGDRVFFPSDLVEKSIAACPRRVLMAGGRRERDVLLDGSRTFFNPSGCAATTLDDLSGRPRPSTLVDLRDGTVVMDSTPELDVMWTFVTATDVPLERRELLEYYTYLTETEKPLVFVDCPSESGPVRAIFELLSGDLESYRKRPRVSVLCAVRAPLEVNGPLLDLTVEYASLGAPVWVYSMPISGATAPVTLAGTLALIWAEVLGTMTAIQCAVPGAPVVACCGPGILDMRTTTMSLGNLESTLMGAACTEIGHHLGLPVHNAGLATDAKSIGIQAGYEKGMKVVTAMATGADIISGGFGFLDACSTFYLPLVPIEAEIVAMARRMVGGIEVSPETLMGEAIERVGIGGNFLAEKETRRRIRTGEHFMPAIAARKPFEQWQAEGRTELDAAREKVAQALAGRAARGPYLTDDQRRELAAICKLSRSETL